MKNIIDIINNKNVSIEESLLTENAAALDSLFHKWNIYNNRLASSNINEAFGSNNDIPLTESESKAASDILVYLCESLISDYEEELNNLQIQEGFKDKIKNIGDKISDKYESLVSSIKDLKDLIKQFKEKAIKSIKELANKFQLFMVKIGLSIADIFKKLKINPDDEEEGFIKMAVDTANNEQEEIKNAKIYENISNYLATGECQINESEIFEFLGFGKKKKEKEGENKEGENKDGNKEGENKDGNKEGEEKDEYKAQNGKEKKVTWKTTIIAAIKQMAIYWLLTFIIPLILTCIPGIGPGLGALVGVIAKVAWSIVGIGKQIQMFVKLVKSDQWKHEMSKKTKIIRTLIFIASLVAAGWALKTAGGDLLGHVKTIWSNGLEKGLKLIAPSGAVEKAAKIIDTLMKKCGGKGFPGWENIENAREAAVTEITKLIKVHADANNGDISGLEDKLKSMGKYGKAAWDQLHANPDMVPNGAIVMDGSIKGGGYNGSNAEVRKKLAEMGFKEGSDYTLSEINMNGKGMFTVAQFKDVTPKLQNAIADITKQMGGKGIVANMGNLSDTVAKVTEKVPVLMAMTHTVPFAGFMPILKNKSGYLLRMGSNKSGNDVYEVTGYKEYTYKDLRENASKLNSDVFNKMDKILADNKKALEDNVKAAEEKGDKKITKAAKKVLDKFNTCLEEQKCLVIAGKLFKKGSKDKKTNESYNSLKDYIFEAEEANTAAAEPVANEKDEDKEKALIFINPLLMCCGDLTDGRLGKRGPRKNPYYLKGILSNIEILPKEGGVSQKDIVNMFIRILQEGIKGAMNMVADLPCIKDGKKYVVNKDSKWGDKKRTDFGNFTNTEITEIVNSKSEAGKYLGGEYNTRNKTVENDSEKVEKNKKQMKEIITNDEEVQKFLDDHKKLKKYLIDDNGEVKDKALDNAYDIIQRSEKAYASGKTKKGGFFAKLKNFFFGDDSDDSSPEAKELKKVDPDDLADFSMLLSKIRGKKKDKKKEDNNENKDKENKDKKDKPVGESLSAYVKKSLSHPLYVGMYENEDDNNDSIFEYNMQTMVDEFNDWLANEDEYIKEELLFDIDESEE